MVLEPTANVALLGREENTPQGVPSHRLKHDRARSKILEKLGAHVYAMLGMALNLL